MRLNDYLMNLRKTGFNRGSTYYLIPESMSCFPS